LPPLPGNKSLVGAAGKGKGSLGLSPLSGSKSLAGAAGKGKGSLGLSPLPGSKSLAGAASKGKGSLGLSPLTDSKSLTGVLGSAGNGKAGVNLLPGTMVAPTSTAKSFLAGKSIIGASTILPGMVAFAGPAGLLPSITAVSVGFGAGFLAPIALVGALMAVVRPQPRKTTGSNPVPPPAPKAPKAQESTQAQKPKQAATFNYAAYGATSKATPYSSEKPAQKNLEQPTANTSQTARTTKGAKRSTSPVGFDRRFTLRIKVPPNAMIVKGVLADRRIFRSHAKDISRHGVRFQAPEGRIHSIQQLIFPKKNITLDLSQHKIHRHTRSDAVVVLFSFANDPDDQMKWIELITRLDQSTV
jgi:hypothetical protein